MSEVAVNPVPLFSLSPSKLGEQVSPSLVRSLESLALQSSRFDWVGVYALESDGFLTLKGCTGALPVHQRIPQGKGVCGRAVTEDRDLNIGDVSRQPEYLACDARTKAELVVLIRDSQGQILGQIDIDSYTAGEFSTSEVNHVQAAAMELGRLWKSLEN